MKEHNHLISTEVKEDLEDEDSLEESYRD